ncbi:small integral membrane protein 24 [Amia ocellicauda]|uniref:small integral membrane protein 24 n=1 Tax=Amia ocellicauda TaxID=2972642 RepID=UPI0034643596
MFVHRSLLVCLLLAVSACEAQHGGLRSNSGSVTLQPWLVGLAAVVGFLFIVFVLLIVKRVFFKKDESHEKPERPWMQGQDNPVLQMDTVKEQEDTQTNF